MGFDMVSFMALSGIMPYTQIFVQRRVQGARGMAGRVLGGDGDLEGLRQGKGAVVEGDAEDGP